MEFERFAYFVLNSISYIGHKIMKISFDIQIFNVGAVPACTVYGDGDRSVPNNV